MIQSVDRALNILHAVAARNSWVGVREVARIVELKVPTVQNILKTLAARGYLEFSEEFRGYRLGIAPLLLADKVDPVRRMAGMVRPYLNEIFEQFGETVTFMTLFGGKVVAVDSIISNEPLTVVEPNRVIEHPHCLASGKLLLAFADEELLRNYAAETPFADLSPNLPKNADEFFQTLETVRRERYAEAINAREQGIGAIAVPVRGPEGSVNFALACSAPLARFDADRRAAVRNALEECAEKIEVRTGAMAPNEKV
jgi:DNA-binding IclR family transcriptional regulator